MTMHDYHTIVPCDGCMNVRTYEVCDECLDGRFIRCAFRGCVRGGRAKSVVAALEAGYWASKHVYRGLDSIVCPSAFMKDQFDKIEGFTRYTCRTLRIWNGKRPAKNDMSSTSAHTTATKVWGPCLRLRGGTLTFGSSSQEEVLSRLL